jgi:hypothetical protein
MEAEDVKSALKDPLAVCQALGLMERAKRNAGGLLVRCPAHNERTPSCSVTCGPDGTVRVKCFGCGLSGDVFTIVAATDGLDPHRDFRRVLERAARIAGLDASEHAPSGPKPMAPPAERPYPPVHQIESTWETATTVASHVGASAYFDARGIPPLELDRLDLVRVMSQPAPPWARYGEHSWFQTGHVALVRAFDADGTFRSLRAIRITYNGADVPKRLPPKGFRASGIVMANQLGVALLDRTNVTTRIMVCEGEPDFLSVAVEPNPCAILGIISGSWTGAMAARIPDRADVLVMTHNDKAGDGYAREINATIGHRCNVLRAKVPT